jgi:uncharacterized protein
LSPDHYYDLLDAAEYSRLSLEPSLLHQQLVGAKPGELVVIDEIQLIPALLNTVHQLIESNQLKFLLTGSSERKLRRGDANMLGGRAWGARLFPLCYHEIGKDFDL